MGETCGMKLIGETHDIPRECGRCEAIRTKLRRREKLVAQYTRWTEENICPASRQKAWEDICALDQQIKLLNDELMYARNNIVNTSSRRRY